MRSSHASRISTPLTKLVSLFCAVTLCYGLVPSAALAADTDSLSLIPEGEQGTVRIVSNAEGGALDTFSHCASDEAPSADAGGAAIPSEDDGIHRDDDVQDESIAPIDRDAAISTIVPLEDTKASSGFEPEDGAHMQEDDADSAASSSERGAFYAGDERYNVVFDANGGDYAPTGAAYKAAFGGEMPSIEGALHFDDEGRAVPPKRDGFVFMGFFDGSDHTVAKKFYTHDFTVDATCERTYPYAADGLRLYAGWAPVLNVTVPTSISIAVGSLPEADAPTVLSDAIVNRSPWPVRCTSLTWDDAELPVVESDLLANKVRMDASSLDAMFSDKEGVYLTLAPAVSSVASSEVQPGGTVALDGAGALTLAAATGTETRLPINYTLRLAEGVEVIDTEKVSRTKLIMPFEAVIASPDEARSTVLFNANGGSGGQSRSLDATLGEALPELTNKTAPIYEGRTFMGWYDDPVYANGTRYYDVNGEPVADVAWDKTSATVLYAGWRTKGCTVTLVAGPAGSTASMDYDKATPSKTYEVLYGHALSTIPGFGGGIPEPYYEDYVFCGWWTARAGGREVDADEVICDYANPTVLYGRWSGFPVTVTWDVRGGSEVAPWESHAAGSELGALPETARAGYTFAGWYTAANGGFRLDETAVINDDAIFYAQWTPNTITLSWDLDGTITQSSFTYREGATVQFPSDLAAPSKGEGWRFRGWYAKDALTGDPAGERISTTTPLPVSDATYTAYWDAQVTFDAGEGAFADGTTSASSFQQVGGTSKLMLPNDPARAGYRLIGWFTTDNVQVDATTPVSAPATYHAQWADERPEVTFDAGEGRFASGKSIYAVRGLAGATIPAPVDPTRIGYAFDGWFTESGAPMPERPVFVVDDVTYVAKWKAKTTTIVFDKNGGDASSDMPLSVVATYGLSMPEIEGAPERSGYEFLGFYDEADGGTAYYDADLRSMKAWNKEDSRVTLYAHWKHGLAPSADVPSGSDGDFYLRLTADQAKAVSTDDLTVEAGYYGASQIKSAAVDIADKGTSSDYYAMFQKIMNNDYKFTSKWYDVSGDNANAHLSTTRDYSIRIIGLNQDYLENRVVDGTRSGKRAGITFQFADEGLSCFYRTNTTTTNATGWKDSEIRARMNPSEGDPHYDDYSPKSSLAYGSSEARGSIWGRAPEGIATNVAPVYKWTHNADGTSHSAVDSTRDAMFLISNQEVMSGSWNRFGYAWLNQESVHGTTYMYWESKKIVSEHGGSAVIMKFRATADSSPSVGFWWHRTVFPDWDKYFIVTYDNGYMVGKTNGANESQNRGVVPCFCF